MAIILVIGGEVFLALVEKIGKINGGEFFPGEIGFKNPKKFFESDWLGFSFESGE